MQGSLARRVALAASMLALIVSLVSVPSSASAQSLFPGPATPPAPSPTQDALTPPAMNPMQGALTPPAQGLMQGALPPAAPSPGPLASLRPDVKVTSLGVVRGADGNGAYSFRVSNVGLGSAPELKITREAVVKRRSDNTWVKTDVTTYGHNSPLRPGQEFVVEVPCPASQHQYCDVGGVLADVVGTIADTDPTNNHAMAFDDIRGT